MSSDHIYTPLHFQVTRLQGFYILTRNNESHTPNALNQQMTIKFIFLCSTKILAKYRKKSNLTKCGYSLNLINHGNTFLHWSL